MMSVTGILASLRDSLPLRAQNFPRFAACG